MSNRKILTIEETAEFLQLGIRTLYEMARKGEIPCRKIAKQWRFDRDRIVEWVGQTVEDISVEKTTAQLKILVVDDEEDILDIISSNLEDAFENSKLYTSQDGINALVTVGQVQPDVMILDIGIPKVDGLEVCRRLKNDPITAGIVIIAITGLEENDLEEKAHAARVDAFMTKPVYIDKLINIIKEKKPSLAKLAIPSNS